MLEFRRSFRKRSREGPGLPSLAIEQAGAYINDAQIRLDEYLPLYNRYYYDLLRRLPLCDIYNNR